jgi:hypothetical protein
MGGSVWLISLFGRDAWSMLLFQISLGAGLYVFLYWVFDRTQLIELLDLVLGARSPLAKKTVSSGAFKTSPGE